MSGVIWEGFAREALSELAGERSEVCQMRRAGRKVLHWRLRHMQKKTLNCRK